MTLAIDPRTCIRRLAAWDLTAAFAMLFTALVTPFEVGFIVLPPDPTCSDKWSDALFLANRFIDCIFVVDLLLQFFIGYPEAETTEEQRYVLELLPIAKRYVSSKWFTLDVFSIATSAFDLVCAGADVQKLTGLRAVRVLRLFKLIRLLKGSTIFKRYEMRASINYAYLSLANVCASILLCCHWFACLWGLQSTFHTLDAWPVFRGLCEPWEHTSLDDCPAGRQCQVPFCTSGDDTTSSVDGLTNGAADTVTCIEGFSCVGPFHMYAVALLFCTNVMLGGGEGVVCARGES